MNMRSLLLTIAGAALCVTPVMAAGTTGKTTTSSAANAAWCKSTEAGLSTSDQARCAEKMNTAKTEQERKDVQSAYLSGSGSTTSSGGRMTTSPSGSSSSPSAMPPSAGSSASPTER